MKLAILDDYQDLALNSAGWSGLEGRVEITVFREHLGDEDAVAEALAGFDAVTCMRERTRLPRSLLERLPKLRLIVTAGMRNRAIDMDCARERGIVVSGTDALGYPAFEHAWALIMALAKNITNEDRTVREGGWQAAPPVGLRGRTLGLLGLGRLGAQTAVIGLAFGMRVIAWSQNLTDARAAEVGVTRVDKDELLRTSDFVSIHLILSERTRGLVGARELGLMKPDAYLVNTSRGPIVDEVALIEALRGDTIAGAGLDVFDVEPLPADHPLRSIPNTVLTAHTGYGVREAFDIIYPEFVEAVAAFLDGTPRKVLNAG